jgi:hypothetical protein
MRDAECGDYSYECNEEAVVMVGIKEGCYRLDRYYRLDVGRLLFRFGSSRVAPDHVATTWKST